MKLTGANLNDLKQSNRTAVLYLLSREGNMSRKDISEKLGLTPAAVTKITRELIEEKLLIEVGQSESPSKAGRKKILLSINSEELFVVAVSLEADVCAYGIYNISAQPIKSEKIPFSHQIDAKSFLEKIGEKICELIASLGINHENILGAGVGIVGSVDENGETFGKYGLWNGKVDVKGILEEKLNMPVKVENNIKSFVLAETIYAGGAAEENRLFIKWGQGVGSAIVINGDVFSSNRNSEAEIGHYIVNPDGKPCRCGRKGCLETYVSLNAVIDRIKSDYSKENTPILYEKTGGDPDKINYQTVFFDASRQDKCVREIIDRRINRMARAVVNAATLFDPDRVVLFGNMFTPETTDKFISYCKGYYEEFSKQYIVLSSLRDKAEYIGAVAIAVKYFMILK